MACGGALPGMVASIQILDAAFSFHPHVHALVNDGLLQRGALLPLASPDLAALEELFSQQVLVALVSAQRLSEGFRDRLLAWRHSGFRVHGEQVVLPDETKRLSHLARYLTRPPLASCRVRAGGPGSFLLKTPIDPSTGATQLELDPLELIHRLAQQIPAPRPHLVRYCGAHANRARRLFRAADEQIGSIVGFMWCHKRHHWSHRRFPLVGG